MDWQVLHLAGIETHAAIRCEVTEVSAQKFLHELLRDLPKGKALAYTIDDGGIIRISTRHALKVQGTTEFPRPVGLEQTQAIRTARLRLAQNISKIHFTDIHLCDVLQFLKDVTQIHVWIDWPRLRKAGIDREANVTLHLRDIAATTIFDLVLTSASGGRYVLGYALDDAGTRVFAAYALTRIQPGTDDFTSEILRALKDLDARGRRAAARVLARLHPPSDEAIDALIGALEDRDREVRWDSVSALSRTGLKGAPTVGRPIELRLCEIRIGLYAAVPLGHWAVSGHQPETPRLRFADFAGDVAGLDGVAAEFVLDEVGLSDGATVFRVAAGAELAAAATMQQAGGVVGDVGRAEHLCGGVGVLRDAIAPHLKEAMHAPSGEA